jgi:phage terminase large subunit-like protein
VRRAILSIARKNGKTAEIAGLVLAHLVGPEAIPNGEIYSAATEREQAAQVFKVAAQMVRADPELNALCRVVDSTKTITCPGNGSFYRAISAEAGSKHGLNPSLVIYDELAQARNRLLYDVLDTAMGGREEPLLIIISTQSPDPQHILSQLIDDGMKSGDPTTVCHLYAVGEDDDVFDEKEWIKANPALADFRSIDDMRAQAARAARMPSFESTFRNLYCNQRVDQESPLIPRAEWVACGGEGSILRAGERVYLGLDLSSTTDLSALAVVSAEDGARVEAWFWKPGDLIRDHGNRDRVDYALWVKRGWISAPAGRVVNYAAIAEKLGELRDAFDVVGVAFDRWRIEQLRERMDEAGVPAWIEGKDDDNGGLRLVPWGQGFKDMAPAIDALESLVLAREFKHNGNPVLTMCFANAMAVKDPAGNRKLDKTKSRLRIDGAVATAMAVGLRALAGEQGPLLTGADALLVF